jgi:hypothetical protein
MEDQMRKRDDGPSIKNIVNLMFYNQNSNKLNSLHMLRRFYNTRKLIANEEYVGGNP